MINTHPPLKKLIVLLIVAILLTACASNIDTSSQKNSEGFAIYLLAQSMPPHELLTANLNDVKLKDTPLINSDDMVSYSKDTHEIVLTSAGYNKFESLYIPTNGVPFVVTVDGEPIYGGAFWSSFSSLSFHGVIIDTTLISQNKSLRLQLGYPESPELFVEEDHRANPKILTALEKAGKLQ